MTAGMLLRTLAQISADRMMNCIVEGVLVAFLAWAILRASGRHSSGTRFAVWFSALLVIASLPLVSSANPARSFASADVRRAAISLPHSWALYLFTAWAIIAGVLLLKLAIGLIRVMQLRRSCTVVDPRNLDSQLQRTLQGFRGIRSVTVYSSSSMNVPAAIGFFRPGVVIPEWAWKELSADELNSILLHELAHLARWDDWTNLAQKVLRSVLFFHPAVWWIESKLSLEREMACDDVVLSHSTSPRAYAECLVSLTEKGLLRRGFDLAQAAIGRVKQTTLRVSQILDGSYPHTTALYRPALVLIAAVSFGCLSLSSHVPQLVSFESGAPKLETASVEAAGVPAVHQAKFSIQRGSNSGIVVPPAPHMVNATLRSVSPAPKAYVPVTNRNLRAPHRAEVGKALKVAYQPRANTMPELQVVVVVMQSREYVTDGQSIWAVTVLRYATFQLTSSAPKSAQDINARKI
jgi:beta-lactamase regulating signal transducer with metallopeptidase domain